MIRDITIGQYYASESIIHRLDPRLKIFSSLIFIISLLFVKELYIYPYVLLYLALIIYLSKVPVKFIFRGLRSIFFMLFFTVFINLFWTPGENILLQFWIIKITEEGLIIAISMAIRILLLITSSSLLTLTTTPIELTDGIEHLLRPLKVFSVPAHEISMMMSIALRFIPTLLDETDKIMKAQQSRGADFENGNIITRAKNLLPILVPLFLSAFRRADELALAMEARCYNGDKNRTKMNVMRYKKIDFFALLISSVYLIGLLVLRNFI